MRLYNADCLEMLKTMKCNSVDSIVTDPPYGISYLNKDWDKCLPTDQIWSECHRVLKPGGHILAFSSARLYHHLAISMENTGFDTHNMLAWIYSSGFPKGVNLSLQLDKADGIPKPDDKFRSYLKEAIRKSKYTIKELESLCGTSGMFSHYLGKSQPSFPNYKNWKIIKEALKLDERYDDLFLKLEKKRAEYKKEKEGVSKSKHIPGLKKEFEKHQAKSELSQKWEGWHYGKAALRPSLEPIYFGQKKPLRPVSENVKCFGVGALNIDGCKIKGRDGNIRIPSNVMHDGSSCIVDLLTRKSAKSALSLNEFSFKEELDSPFFSIPKPAKSERGENDHPTLKPIALMRQLVRLVTPSGGICLDPFMGSGTTGVACGLEEIDFIGIEREREYWQIAMKRLEEFERKAA